MTKTTKTENTPKTETKAVKTPKAEKVSKKATTLTIFDIVEQLKKRGIVCKNLELKGKYRIIASKTSVSVKDSEYVIYACDSDFENIQNAKIKAEDLKLEKGTNARDKVRANVVICKTDATLNTILDVLAKNELNQEKKEVEKK